MDDQRYMQDQQFVDEQRYATLAEPRWRSPVEIARELAIIMGLSVAIIALVTGMHMVLPSIGA